MKRLVSGVLCVLLFSPGVFAQEYPEQAYLTEDDQKYWEMTLDSRYIGKTDAGNMSGGVGVTETELDLVYDFELDNGMPVAVSFLARHVDIDNSTAVDLPSHLEGRTLGLSAKFPIPFVQSDHYFMGVDVYPSMFTDDWDWEDSAFRIPFRTYFIYRKHADFILVAGVRVRPDYDEKVLPVLGMIWRPNDRLTFNLASLEPDISYKLNDHWTAFLEFELVNEEYEVTRGAQKNVVLIHKSYSSGAGLRYTFKKTVEAAVSVGGVFAREFEYRDTRQEVEPDAGVYAKAKLTVQF